MPNSDTQPGSTISVKVPSRTAVNLDPDVWVMVHDECKIDEPDEKPNMSKMTRILLREAIKARKAKRGKKKARKSESEI